LVSSWLFAYFAIEGQESPPARQDEPFGRERRSWAGRLPKQPTSKRWRQAEKTAPL